jgi:hypothetical protein
MATLITLVDGTVATVAPVNANFQALNTEVGRSVLTQYSVASQFIVTTGTIEETLATYTLPANTVVLAGDGIEVSGSGSCTATADAKTLKFYLGASTITLNPTTTAPNNKTWNFRLRLTYQSTNNWIWDGTMLFGAASGTSPTLELGGQLNVGGSSPTGAIVVKFTATTPGGAGQVTLRTYTVSTFKVAP